MYSQLNTSQYSSLAIALLRFELNLRQAQSSLQGEQVTGIMFRTRLHLSEDNRAAMMVQIAEGLAGIARLAERFNLQPVEEPLANKIAAGMSESWTNLVDSSSDKLGRYGDADPVLRLTLDPELEHLAQVALSIASLARD